MDVRRFTEALGTDFYTGVPDSQLRPLCDFLMDKYGIDGSHHIIAANEGNCVAIGAGHHLATGCVPVIYLQNSGQGNILNPIVSLMSDKVYGMPCILVIGWRGEPGTHDEPQHVHQGEITVKVLEDMGISSFNMTKDTADSDVERIIREWEPFLKAGKQVAFVISSGALTYDRKVRYSNSDGLSREEVIEHVTKVTGCDPIVSTTGKCSRELFEARESNGQDHRYDFLTVGSMGHSSSIALGIAISRPDVKVWCIDGDGAVIMHMGAMATVGSIRPKNMVHLVINNRSHESVGGMPTVSGSMDMTAIAKACGYAHAVRVEDHRILDEELMKAKEREGSTFIEVRCSIGSRADLGRPTTTAKDNKEMFMEHLKSI